MKTNWMAIGIAAASAAILYYPAKKLYQFISNKLQDKKDAETHVVKAFSPAYRGKNRSHNRQAHNGHNGAADMGHA